MRFMRADLPEAGVLFILTMEKVSRRRKSLHKLCALSEGDHLVVNSRIENDIEKYQVWSKPSRKAAVMLRVHGWQRR